MAMKDLTLLALVIAVVAGASATNRHAAAPSLCFEQLSSIPAVFLAEHPGGKGLVAAQQNGLITLLSRPPVGNYSLAKLQGVFLDLTKRVLYAGEQGLLSFAFHPKFLTNGRFFVSYICDSTVFKDCQGPCLCTPANGCQYKGVTYKGKALPATTCIWNTVVSEFNVNAVTASVNGTLTPVNGSKVSPATATSLNAKEVRKIFNFARPYHNHNGGHIWFGRDGMLYYASGDGGKEGDPLNITQKGNLPFGKVFRVDVDSPPHTQALGSYAVPTSNPFVSRSGVLPEMYALGLRNAWRCSEDPFTAKIFCGDTGQDAQEEIDLVVAGGNYGWPYYEGTALFSNPLYKSFKPSSSPLGGSYIKPIFAYSHPANQAISRAVTGGYVYRAQRNKCLQGQYIFSDNYGPVYVGTQEVLYGCPKGKACALKSFPAGYLWSWGVDNAQELYLLSTTGIHRIVNSTDCGYAC